MNSQFHRVIGIDLGTTFSAVAAYNSSTDQCEIINNSAESDRNPATTPSAQELDRAVALTVGVAVQFEVDVRAGGPAAARV